MLTFTKAIEEVEKDMTVGDVHAATALGNSKKKPTTLKDRLLAGTDDGEDATKRDAWSLPVTIIKVDKKQQLVFGWASVAEINGELVVDKQDDIIMPDELEKAAHQFVLDLQDTDAAKVQKYLDAHAPEIGKAFAATAVGKRATGMGDMHEVQGAGRLVAAIMFSKQLQEVLGIDLGLQGWFVGFKVDNPDTWAKIESGEQPEFSIGGTGQRVEVA